MHLGAAFRSRYQTSGRPPFEVHHFAGSRRSLSNLANADIALSAALDKLVFSLGESTGNIWMLKSERQP